ncbi:MAG: DUF1598 domain-containing protein [Planctomycetes bacterium]|nr:DUF1598 domain-containing protein [Planctomycetota bacterium]
MSNKRLSIVLAGTLLGLVLLMPLAEALAGCCLRFRNRAVGGVNIDAEGVLVESIRQYRDELRAEMLRDAKEVPPGMHPPVEIRKISLRGLNQAIADAYENHMGVIPDEVQYLGGLQRIQYIFVYPEHSDIVIAGPAEGWKIDGNGNVVGQTTGRPVLQLDDLLVALRTADEARTEGISCSIDPTAEGRQRLDAFLSQQRTFSPAVVRGVEEALGLQQVSITGVPADSRFARMMVAADYRMKRIAMKLEQAPVRGLPSYLDMAPPTGNMTPRWWLACNYDTVHRSEDNLAFEIRGQGVKVLTEDEFVEADGSIKQSGRTSAPAERWANLMTEKFDELAVAEPVFGELRNLMDLCVAAALIKKYDLLSVAGCELPRLMETERGAMLEAWNAPKAIATQCSFAKRGNRYVITASGGVQIESWEVASQTAVDPQIAETRERSASSMSNWWWN